MTARPLTVLDRYPATGAAEVEAGPAVTLYRVEPGSVGIEALEAIRGNRLTRQIPGSHGVYVMVTPEYQTKTTARG